MAGLNEEGLPPGYPLKPEWEVTPRRVKAMMDAGEIGGDARGVLLDCRRPEEWAIGVIAGAVQIGMSEVAQRADEFEDDEGGKDRPIVVYCHTGRRSLIVASALRGMGFSDVRSMAGGIELWSLDIDPSVPRY